MFLRSKIIEKFRFLSQRSFSFFQNNKRVIENVAIGAGMAASAYHYPEAMESNTQKHIRLFKSSLTPEQKKEMDASPEKNREYMEKCKEELARSFRYD